tara:strand:+ start:4155 stop:5012 length:858 start_codon:yes stop_codon:yes gene_type:complete
MIKWEDYLEAYRRSKNFNNEGWVRLKVKKFNEYLGKHNLSGAVLSVSGGIDSAVTLGLLQRTKALPNSNLKKILAISQPIHSSDWAYNRAKELCDKFNIELTVIDQTEIFDNLVNVVEANSGIKSNKFSGGQLRSYMRTPVNYYCAQLLTSQGFPSIVMGTGNMDEDGYLAYFCKAGDGVVDVQLISDLHKSEVFKVGKFLGITESILEAKPSADLWEDQEDEKELGFTYDFIEFYTGVYLKWDEKNNTLKNLTEDSYREFIKFEEKCVAVHNRNKHKIEGIINL